MAIKSSKHEDDAKRVISSNENIQDSQNDIKLRPKTIEDYIGQDAIKKHLRVAIESAKIRQEPLEHILLY